LVHSETFGGVMNRGSRRAFMLALSRGAALGGSAVLLGDVIPAMLQRAAFDSPVVSDFSLSSATPQTFAPYIGTAFQILAPHGVIADAVLTHVTTLPRHNRAATVRDPFSLMFSAPNGGRAFHSVVTLRHAQLGCLELSVRATEQTTGQVYEAVFG
jgi:hypothetical protein